MKLLLTGWYSLWNPLGHRSPPLCLNPTSLNAAPSSRYNKMKTMQHMERLLIYSTALAMVPLLATDHLQRLWAVLHFYEGLSQILIPSREKICSDLVSRFVKQPSLLPFPHRYLWLTLSSIHFSLFSVDSRSTFIKLSRMFKCYGNLHRNAVKASDLCVKTELATAERQQRRQSPNRSR